MSIGFQEFLLTPLFEREIDSSVKQTWIFLTMGDLYQILLNLSSVSEGRTVGRTDRQTEGQKLIRKTQVSSNKIDWFILLLYCDIKVY